MTNAPDVVARIRTQVRQLRERRRAQDDLRRQLAAYTSQADVYDLVATLSSHEGPDVEEMRSMLSQQLLERQRHRAQLPYAS